MAVWRYLTKLTFSLNFFTRMDLIIKGILKGILYKTPPVWWVGFSTGGLRCHPWVISGLNSAVLCRKFRPFIVCWQRPTYACKADA